MYQSSATGASADLEDDMPPSQCRSCVADLQFAPTGCTAKQLFSIYDKQLRSIGLPALKVTSSGTDDDGVDESCVEPAKWLRFFTFVTDDGPDQKACQKIIGDAFKNDPRTLVFRLKCLLHQLHLTVAKQLKRLDGHYSDVAKIVNTWRGTGIPMKIFKASGKNPVYKSLPRRALKGRWGSMSAAENYLLRCGFEELPKIFSDALGALPLDDADLLQVVDISNVLEMDTALYKTVMGKWRRDAIAALNSTAFWIRLAVAHFTRKPIDHLMHWIMSTANMAPTEAEGDSSSPALVASSGKLPPLLFGTLDRIMEEFKVDVLNSDSPQWEMFHTLVSKDETKFMNETSWVAMLVSTALEMASEIHRRFVDYLGTFPARLAWMIFEEPDIACDVRKATAAYFLACADLDEDFSKKFRHHFWDQFKLCSETGCICPTLHQLIMDSLVFFKIRLLFWEILLPFSLVSNIFQLCRAFQFFFASDDVQVLTPQGPEGQTASKPSTKLS